MCVCVCTPCVLGCVVMDCAMMTASTPDTCLAGVCGKYVCAGWDVLAVVLSFVRHVRSIWLVCNVDHVAP